MVWERGKGFRREAGDWVMSEWSVYDGWVEVFTGYGVFGKYLHRIKVEEIDSYWFCEEPGVADSPEHTIWGCPKLETDRNEARGAGLNLDRGTIGYELVESECKWRAFECMVKKIMRKKIERERYRRTRTEA
ncbi:uncharacterized protein [Euwallacea fornicatus]|uniref:uncharacterized protein n=1 Tax=Euwallacea fornicatus TaxID=995702 RepID=UPI00338F5457